MRLAPAAVIPALLTPYDADGAVDRDALRAHVGWLVDQGVDGIMPCGTTGETAFLSDDEVVEVVEAVAVSAVVPYYHVLEPDMVLGHYRALMDAFGPERTLAYLSLIHISEPTRH